MRQEDAAEGTRELAELIPPIRGPVGRELKLIERAVDDRAEQLVLARDVAIQGHRRDAELRRDPAEADRLESARVGDRERRLDDELAGQC